jgi:hypothetical protein
MKAQSSRLGAFWIRLAIAYIVLVIIWPFVYSAYARHLGTISAPVAQWLVNGPVHTRSGWHEGQLAMHVVLADRSGTKRDIGVDVDPIRLGFSHITFLALVIAVPGWSWRRRVPRWLIGAVGIEAFNVGVIMAAVFGEIATMNLDFWPGDVVTSMLPRALLTNYLNLLSLVGAQFVPILFWLLLLVFPLRRGDDAKRHQGRPAARGQRPPHALPHLKRRAA